MTRRQTALMASRSRPGGARATARSAQRRPTKVRPGADATPENPPPNGAPGDCREQLAELFAYLDGELTPSRCRVIERHLVACPCCDRLAGELRQAIAVCRMGGQVRVPVAIRARAQAAARALLGPRRR